MNVKKVLGLLLLGSACSFADSITATSNATGVVQNYSSSNGSLQINDTSSYGGAQGSINMGGSNGEYDISMALDSWKNFLGPDFNIAPELLGATVTIKLDLPSDSGNWVATGSVSETDDEGIPGLNGTTPINTTLQHTPGTPITYTYQLTSTVYTQQSFDDFRVNIHLVDPIDSNAVTMSDAPEPSTWSLLFLPLVALVGYRVKCAYNRRMNNNKF